jgi:hypothetical protein
MCVAFRIPVIVDVRFSLREFSAVVIVICVVKKRPRYSPGSFCDFYDAFFYFTTINLFLFTFPLADNAAILKAVRKIFNYFCCIG